MNVNAEFAERVVIHSQTLEWQDSPIKGVKRRMLDRVGAEVARATSIVSYEPGSHFSSHVHTGGEEFIVLDGVFQDEHGDFPVGSYIRNPPQSSHTPGSKPGCVIFVKLWQFDLEDRTHIRTDMQKAGFVRDAGRQGVSVSTLYSDEREQVRFETWDPNSTITLDAAKGAELLVLDGDFTESREKLETLSWMRLPVGSSFSAQTGALGAKVWIKTGHLVFAQEEAERLPVTHQ
ncbi:MAG: cupin domain-containing protein [Granulosicoccus sp.]